MSISLYRKYRPQSFADVSGQSAAVDVITNSIAKSRVGHAYLFSGSRGCGKTSVARIFAKALNCLEREENNFEPCGKCSNCISITSGENLDVIEIDGASNNSVDEVRELKANVTLMAFNSRYKIYIIDEVHMLSTAAFNALLKTLEEPPEHVVFILATTEPHKVPVTIRSRCQHIPFHSITPEDIFSRLNFVCEHENIIAEPEALWEISRQADGALRDALSILEQISAAGDVTLKNLEITLGAGSRTSFERWLKTFREDRGQAYITLKSMFDSGASASRVFEELFILVRNLWLVSKWPNIAESLGASEQEKNFLRDESNNWETEKLHSLLNAINKILVQARMGIRNEILLGMFALFVEPALTDVSVPVAMPVQIIQSDTSDTSDRSDRELTPVQKLEYDPAFHEEIIKLANEKNFVISCALYHAKPYKNNDDLIFEIDDKFIYENLKLDRIAAEIREIFSDYAKVLLKFGTNETICPDFAVREENNKQADNIPTEPEIINDSSSFSKFRNILVRNGIKHEVIIMKHKETTETESHELDYDVTESEGDEN